MSRHSSPDLLQLDPSENRDPGHLRRVLSAHFNYEQMRVYRRVLVGFLAALGGGFWVAALWPGGVGERVRAAGVKVFAGCLVATLIAGALELKWHRRRARLTRGREGGSHGTQAGSPEL
jgi:hypothetical protein